MLIRNKNELFNLDLKNKIYNLKLFDYNIKNL